jgi:diaminopimelate decarboxylase
VKPTQYQNDTLFVDGVALDDLAQQYGTPVYVYSEAALSSAYEQYRQAFAAFDPLICYAIKANSNLSILRHFARLGSGFDIVSGGELERVLAAGAAPERIVFSGVGKSDAEMSAALQAGIRCFNIESINELLKLNSVAARLKLIAPISLRVNPDVDAQTHPYISTGLKDNKFGIAFDSALDVYLQAAQLKNLQITGIDCHIGSQLTDATPVVHALDRLLILVDQLHEHGIHLRHLDIGGGMGIRYDDETPPDISAFAREIGLRLQGRKLELILEPGRSLVGNAGLLLTRIEYLKLGESKNFAVVDAAMNDLMRPALYSAYHAILPVQRHAGVLPLTVDVVGPICESGDFLGKDRKLPVLEGDLLAVMSAGAYGSSMASNYNTRTRPAEVMVSGAQTRLIRKRETLGELLANEKDCLD